MLNIKKWMKKGRKGRGIEWKKITSRKTIKGERNKSLREKKHTPEDLILFHLVCLLGVSVHVTKIQFPSVLKNKQK